MFLILKRALLTPQKVPQKESACQGTDVLQLSGLACQSCGRPKLARFRSKSFGFLLQREANDAGGALQVQQGRIQDDVVQMRIVWLLMVLPLQIACSLMIFPVDARLGSVAIDAFALHDRAHAFFKRGNDADVQDIGPVSQDHLRGASDDHDMTSDSGGPDNPVHYPAIILIRK